MKKFNIIRIILPFSWLILTSALLIRCANPASPSGGPKDETPPRIVSSDPENYSANFSDREMSVKFDEFIQLKDLQQQMLISPPMENKPEIKIKKRSVVIKLDKEEKLKQNTTYTIFLGNAVVDLTESNPYLNLEYVFSTGDFVDSLSIRGKVKNMFSGLPAENVSVMLYADENDTIPLDSLPIKVRPNYVAKTDEEGNFGLYNLRDVPYKIFALNDQNSNYLYDLPYEEIAFLDSMIAPYYTGKRIHSTLDSTKMDSLKPFVFEHIPTELFMFTTYDSVQHIAESGVKEDYKIQIVLDYPCDSYMIKPLNFDPKTDWKIDEANSRKDTLIFWIKPVVPDTIQVEFSADKIILDTLDFVIKKPPKKQSKGKGLGGLFKKTDIDTVSAKKQTPLKIISNISKPLVDINQKPLMEFDYPLEKFDFSTFIWMEDSVVSKPEIKFADDANRKIIIDKELQEKVKYELIIPDSVLFNIQGKTNDSIHYIFSTKNKDQYGNLIMTIIPEDHSSPWIIQLMNNKGMVLQERTINKTEVVRFEFLQPGAYKLRAIQDSNKNGYWDTGNYAYKRQPEKMVYLETDIELRANWDYEENWNLK